MTRYRFRGIFLLFLVGHATACAGGSSWQSTGLSPSLDSADVSGGNSVAHYIESTQPDQVRITTEDRTQYLLYSPSVENDVIVSADGLSVPIADIVNLEPRYYYQLWGWWPSTPFFHVIHVRLSLLSATVMETLLENVPDPAVRTDGRVAGLPAVINAFSISHP